MIKLLSAKQYGKTLKATIQSSGRLGFTDNSAKEFELEKPTWIKMAEDDENPDTLYMVILRTADEDAFQVCKAGNYYYLPTKYLFDALDYDYAGKKIMFDIVRMKDMDHDFGGPVYKMKRRFGKSQKEESEE